MRSETHQRLAAAQARLEVLELERLYEGNDTRIRAEEDQIVSQELLDLELQEVDQLIDRICNAVM